MTLCILYVCTYIGQEQADKAGWIYMWDYSDGSQFKEHLLYKDHPEALQIHLYFDELEVCNPLGSRALKHKLGMYVSTVNTFIV